MIIEALFKYSLYVLHFAISLLPENGGAMGEIPKISMSILKGITMMNGYLPVSEIGVSLGIMITAVTLSVTLKVTYWAYQELIKLKP